MNKTTTKLQDKETVPGSGAANRAVQKKTLFSIDGTNSKFGLQQVIAFAFFAVVWCMLAFYEWAFLKRLDSMSLFLFDGYYFNSMTAAPSGLMSYIGCFLIQFFHYPLLGAAIYVALLYAVYALVRKVFDIPAKYSLLALLPSVALLASDTQLGYWLFMLKLPGYYYVALVATVVSLLAMWLYKKLSPVWRMPLMLVWAVAGYPVMGVYALCATLLMALMGLVKAVIEKKGTALSVATLVLALVLVYFVPRYFYYYYYDSVSLDEIYMAGTPIRQWHEGLVANVQHETASFWHSIEVYWYPFCLLLLSFVAYTAIPLAKRLKFCTAAVKAGVSLLVFAFCIFFAVLYWFSDNNFRIENKQNVAMWEEDWQSVVDYAKETDEPTRQIIMNKNLALLKLGRTGNWSFSAFDGGIEPVAPFAVHMTHTDGSNVYFHYGKFNFCYRWCMENSVEYGWRPEYLKNAARSMLLNGDYRLAERYVRILKNTMFHDEWAEELEKYIENPELIENSKEFKSVLSMYSYNDALAADESVIEKYLLDDISVLKDVDNARFDLLDNVMEGDAEGFWNTLNTVEKSLDYHEASLVMSLVKKDSKLFWQVLPAYREEYVKARGDKALPKNIQEAMLLFYRLVDLEIKGKKLSPNSPKAASMYNAMASMLKSPNAQNADKMSADFMNTFVSGSVRMKLDQFMITNNKFQELYRYATDERMNRTLAKTMRKDFGDSYFFYYFFVKKIKTY